MSEPLLSIEDLSVAFRTDAGDFAAVDHISFDVKKGKTLIIVGESGSGKSVTSLSILRLLPQPPLTSTGGRILFHYNEKTINLLSCSQAELNALRGNAISMIFQEPMTALNPVKTLGSQVAESLSTHFGIMGKAAREKAIAMFQQVQLPAPSELYHKYPHQISGGQKQRVMIAMAMICRPQLLICDEPTTALDVTVQKSILLMLKELQQQYGMSVIFITHDMGVVSEIADEVVVMYKGKVVEKGAAKQVLFHPEAAYTKALLRCRPALYRRGERLPVISDFLEPQTAPQVKKVITNSEVNKVFDPLLRVQNASVWFPSKRNLTGKAVHFNKAVDDVSFEIFEGETLGLVGESGCGKTSLGRALLQLIPLKSGKISFRNRDLTRLSKNELAALRTDMQIIFQDPYSSLDPLQKIGEAIAEPLKVHRPGFSEKQRRETVIALLEKVGLSASFYSRYPHEFSGGQRQRIVIARALALKPSFVVCDESVSALDVSVQAQVLNLLNDLKKEFQFTALFISHDLSVIRYISDRIMVMNKGKIEETGKAEDIYLHPSSSYTRKLIDSIPGKILNTVNG